MKHKQKNAAAQDTCGGIDFLSEYERNSVKQGVPDYSPEATRNSTQGYTYYRMKLCIEPFLNTNGGKESQAQTVKQEKGYLKLLVEVFNDKGQDCCQENDTADKDIVHPEHRYAQQKVPNRPTTYRSHECDNEDAERIKPLLHSGKSAGHCECNGSDDFDGKVKVVVNVQVGDK